MWFTDIENFLRCARLDEFGQNLASIVFGVLDLRMQLAVGKCAGSSFTELDIRFGIKFSLAPETERVFCSFPDLFAALDNDGAEAALCQYQRCEQGRSYSEN